MNKLRASILELFLKRGLMTSAQIFHRYRGPERWETLEVEMRAMLADGTIGVTNRKFYLRHREQVVKAVNAYWLEQHKSS